MSSPDLGPLVAGVLAQRGSPSAWVVHGSDGLDELTLAGPSTVWAVIDGAVEERTVVPGDAGLERVADGEMAGGGPERNAELFRSLLAGATGPVRDLVLLNAAAGLVVADVVTDLAAGVAAGAQALADGSVEDLYRRLAERTGQLA